MAGKADIVNGIVDTTARKFPYYDGWGVTVEEDSDASGAPLLAPSGSLIDPLGGG